MRTASWSYRGSSGTEPCHTWWVPDQFLKPKPLNPGGSSRMEPCHTGWVPDQSLAELLGIFGLMAAPDQRVHFYWVLCCLGCTGGASMHIHTHTHTRTHTHACTHYKCIYTGVVYTYIFAHFIQCLQRWLDPANRLTNQQHATA